MSNCTKADQHICSHSQKGVQGRSPCKKNDVILRARPQTCGARRISCRAHLQARRGACTEKFDVNNRIIIVKRSCLYF